MKIKSGTGTNMMRLTCGIAVALFLLVEASSGWSQQFYIYSPKAVGAAGNVQNKADILVQEVSVQKGDTLSGISHRFNGRGSYYPQILLFNDIKNPNKIYPGNVFKIPVPRSTMSRHVDNAPVKNEKAVKSGGEVTIPRNTDETTLQKQAPTLPSAVLVTDIPTQDLKKVDAGREKKRGAREKVARAAKKQVTSEKHHSTADGAKVSASGQKLFESAVKFYRQDDFRAALELFNRFLAENQTSPLAADASLYKAECYLKLSTQN